MTGNKRLTFFLLTPKKICWRYLSESPRCGNYNKYSQYMFLGILTTTFLNISYNLSHIQVWNCSIQMVLITSFGIILKIGIKKVVCFNNVFLMLVLCDPGTLLTNPQLYWLPLSVRLKHPNLSPDRESAPHCRTIALGWYISITFVIT